MDRRPGSTAAPAWPGNHGQDFRHEGRRLALRVRRTGKPVLVQCASAKVVRLEHAEVTETQDVEHSLSLEFLGSRMLVVDDEPINREIAAMLFEDIGFAVETADDGLQAVEKVLMGRLPLDPDGHADAPHGWPEATRRIRAMPEGEKQLIIAMTANAFAEDRQRCLARHGSVLYQAD